MYNVKCLSFTQWIVCTVFPSFTGTMAEAKMTWRKTEIGSLCLEVMLAV